MAVIGAIITIGTAAAFAYAGMRMLSLESQAGNTIAELFDQAMGIFSLGMAGLVLLGGIGVDRLIAIAGGKGSASAKAPVAWSQKPGEG